MARVSEMIESKYLRKEDVDDDLDVTVKDVTLEDMPGDAGERRWVMWFRELPKAMVLNVTAIRVMAKAYGDDTDGWLGNTVTLYMDPNVSFKGQVVGGLRLRPRRKPAAKPAEKVTEPFDDNINF